MIWVPDAYDDWKFRASRALKHKERERTFLILWINRVAREAAKAQVVASKEDQLRKLQADVSEFIASATPYVPVFSKENPPTDRRKSEERRVELADLKIEYGEFLTHLKEKARSFGFPDSFQGGGRGKVAGVVQKMERELLLIKKSRREADNWEVNRLPNALPSGNSDLVGIFRDIRETKAQLGMDGSQMTVYLFNLITQNKEKMCIKPEQEETLGLIERYVNLTTQRRKIEFRE